jgi:DNA-binding Lrp family transcriptional regulator
MPDAPSKKSMRKTGLKTGELDESDLRLLQAKQTFPMASVEELAGHANVNVATARRRLRVLREQGAYSFDVVIHNKIYPQRAVIFIDVACPKFSEHKNPDYSDIYTFANYLRLGLVKNVAENLRGNIFVERVEIVLGGKCDILLFLAARDSASIFQFVTQHITSLPVVEHTLSGMSYSQHELQRISEAQKSLPKLGIQKTIRKLSK